MRADHETERQIEFLQRNRHLLSWHARLILPLMVWLSRKLYRFQKP